jgi:hypothetical protein
MIKVNGEMLMINNVWFDVSNNGTRMILVENKDIVDLMITSGDIEDARADECYNYHNLFCDCTGEISFDTWIYSIENDFRSNNISDEEYRLVYPVQYEATKNFKKIFADIGIAI